MNHLAHFAMADGDQALIVGGFLGDYIKGRLEGRLPQDIEKGVRLHRAIDRFTDSHRIPKESARRLPEKFHRYGGIIMDIAYDHLLALNWHRFHEQPLVDFSEETLKKLLLSKEHLPDNALQTARRMQEHNSLAGYGNLAFVERSLSFLSTRLKRSNPLQEATPEVVNHIGELETDLADFYPELKEFCDEWINAQSN